MARKGQLLKVLEDLESGFLRPFAWGIQRAATEVVRELQEAGPQWTGEFANSWEIASNSKVVSGTGSPGAPQKIQAPPLSIDEFKFKPETKYYIANKAPYADVALDLAPYSYEGLDKNSNLGEPIKNPGSIEYGTRPAGGKRGDVQGSGSNRSTAPLDWYTNYMRAGKFDKAISLYMDQALRNKRV